jgi:sugar fermentation stimulation protein A
MRSLLNRDSDRGGERREVLYSKDINPKRKLPFTLEAIKAGGEWVISNTLRVNSIVESALKAGELPGIYKGGEIRREFSIGDSRIDFLLAGRLLMEVKSVTYFDGSACYFPDAPTERGRKHLATMAEAVQQGYSALILYVCMVKRDSFKIADDIDPAYAAAVKETKIEGRAVFCEFSDSAGTAVLKEERY